MNELDQNMSCDRCGQAVKALYLIRLIDGELSFCGHHYNQYKEKLNTISFETIELNKTEEVLADML